MSKPPHRLTRVAFKVSRLMEFCSRRELQNQTGHDLWDWPLVVLKEFLDNALDACEEAEVAPRISIAVRDGEISIEDNGTGIDAGTVKLVCDYSIRVSSREAYVSPSRGAQGNALKTILAMGYVIGRERGLGSRETLIEARGLAHRIAFDVDHVTVEPKIAYATSPSRRKLGTKVTVRWPLAFPHCEGRFKELAQAYCWFNPHLSLRGSWNGVSFVDVKAFDPAWTKWRPRDPTSPHWYDAARLQRYMAAHVARDRDLGPISQRRPLRDFIGEFRGLSSTVKRRRILAEIGASHRSLVDFFGRDKVNSDGIAQLLAVMQAHSAPVKPKHLGIIGAEHLNACFVAAGGAPETFSYQRRMRIDELSHLPYVAEIAFGLHASGLDAPEPLRLRPAAGDPGRMVLTGGGPARKIVTGANWSVGLVNPFRTFGQTGAGLENTLAEVRANTQQPVICAVHLACAHLQFADRGKSSIITPGDPEREKDDDEGY